VRVTVGGFVLLLAYGTVVHLLQLLTSGFEPYPALPGWLRAYFVALTVVNPVAAVLIARRHRSGVVLATTVLVTDAAANGWANYALNDTAGITVGRVGQAVITLLAMGLLIALPGLWRATSPGRLHADDLVQDWPRVAFTRARPWDRWSGSGSSGTSCPTAATTRSGRTLTS